MSTADEKYRSIFRMKDVLRALSRSSKCKIPEAWRKEIYYATKHAPFPSEEITIGDGLGFRIFSQDESISDLQNYVDQIDALCGSVKSNGTKSTKQTKRKATRSTTTRKSSAKRSKV